MNMCCWKKKIQISNHEDPLSGQHRGNGVVEYVEEVEAPEWHAVIGPELHPHIYEFMPQRYVCCLINWSHFGHASWRNMTLNVCVTCRVANWLSHKFQAKEAQQQVKSWTEKLVRCLADTVQDLGRLSDKPYVEMTKNEINE